MPGPRADVTMGVRASGVRAPSFVDLFCGCGGLSFGLKQAGFHPLLSMDSSRAAVRTYRHNVGSHVRHGMVGDATSLPGTDLIVGGPPCQGFSSAGLRRDGDERNGLVRTFALLVATNRPKAFLFENVEGFLTTDGGRHLDDLLDVVVDAGYAVHVRKVNAASYGVPQLRKRVFVVGGLGWLPTFPDPTHRAFGAPGAGIGDSADLPPTPTLARCLAGLPVATPISPERREALDHRFAPFGPDDRARASLLRPGQGMRDLPPELQHGSYLRRANRRVADGTPTERRGGAPSGLRRLDGSMPSKAITGGALREFVHPDEDRPLTIRECARLQGFPDDFVFTGTRQEAIRQIGNAVPVPLARAIGTSLLADLERCHTPAAPGVATFVPTASAGMSPVLRSVTSHVERRYMSGCMTDRQLVLP